MRSRSSSPYGHCAPLREQWQESRAVLLTSRSARSNLSSEREQCSHFHRNEGDAEMQPTEPTPRPESPRYLEPGWFTRNVFNRIVVALTRLGVSVRGSRELRVRGRKSGEWRKVPVNLLL